jgi:ABC-type transport system substrate-binding protein
MKTLVGARVTRIVQCMIWLGLAAACLVVPQPSMAQPELTYLEGVEMSAMDPMRSYSNPDGAVLYLLYEGLTWMDTTGAIRPMLATSWSVSQNGLTWRFNLRSGARFSDGTPVTGKDAKYTIDRFTDSRHTSRARLTAIEGSDAPDDRTLIIRTKTPLPDLPMLLSIRGALIVQQAAVEKLGPDYDQHPVGSGPYMLQEFVGGDRVTLVPNPHYTGAQKARFSRVTRRIVPEASSRVAALTRGEAQLALNLPPESVASLSGQAQLQVQREPAALGVSFEINVLKPYLSDRRVRQALNYAVDKDAIVRNILLGNGVVVDSPASLGIAGRVKTGPYEYNPARAKALLAEAGVPPKWKLALWASPERYAKGRQVVEAVQGYLTAVGIDPELRLFEWGLANAEWPKDPRTSAKELFFAGRASETMDVHLTRLFHTSSAYGGSAAYAGGGYSNPAVDKLLDEARGLFDQGRRDALYAQAQRLIWDDAAFLWLHSESNIFAHRKDIEGVVVRPNQELILNGAGPR